MRPSLTRLVYRLPPTISRLSKVPVNAEEQVSVTGFVKSVRRQKRVSFAVISDGSSSQGLQAVFSNTSLINGCVDNNRFIAFTLTYSVGRVTNGASVRLTGKLVESPGQKQDKELLVEATEILGECDPEVCFFLARNSQFLHALAGVPYTKATTFTGTLARESSLAHSYNPTCRCPSAS